MPIHNRINIADVIGKKFGYLTVLSAAENRIVPSGITRMVMCRCECGNVKPYQFHAIKNGKTRSCGCYSKKPIQERERVGTERHLMSYTPEHRAWSSMKNRVCNPNVIGYNYYGGRGITVCDRWLNSFENFLEDMGNRPSDKHSLDRIDVNGNYEPSNCRWATIEQQNSNKTSNVMVTYKGETKYLAEWARVLNTSQQLLMYRLNVAKWSVEKTFETPIKKIRKKKCIGLT
jgi:hypothetical protein